MNSHPHESEHPGDRAWEPDDPLQLDAVPVQGDPAVMLTCLVEEFARMGMAVAEIEQLFESPFFQATHGLKQVFGPAELRRRIRKVVEQSGVMTVRITVPSQSDEQAEDEPVPPTHNRHGR